MLAFGTDGLIESENLRNFIMRKFHLILVAGLCGGFGGMAAVQAADLKAGQALHEQHCLSCHDSGVYTRADRRVTSPEGLRKQVQRCELSLGLSWYDEDVDNVAHYLDQTYYKF